ncbi:MAG: hypothetical protein CL672_00635 [Balneola sp.]|nr:hypothetical protein [Balneola sp.]
MIRPKTGLLFFSCIIAFCGCITTEYLPYDHLSRESKHKNFLVKIYNQEQLNENEYEIIGEFSVAGCSCEIEKILKKIKDRVRDEGGEGIIDLSLLGGVGGRISADNYLITGKAIIFVKNKVLH